MLWNAKNIALSFNNCKTDIVSFGKGEKKLVIIPGLGDGIKNVKGLALPLAYKYKEFTKTYKVYVISRKTPLPENYSTKEMANDLFLTMNYLGLKKADILGISMGGMIAQCLAINHPEAVNKLVLAVTLSKPNQTSENLINNWLFLAKNSNYSALMTDTAIHSYSYTYLKKNKYLVSLTSKIGSPKSFDRFETMANACLKHNSYDELEKISCPVLIIGGKKDKIVTGKASYEIAGKIKNSKIIMHNHFGHALYDEAKDFNKIVYDFLNI